MKPYVLLVASIAMSTSAFAAKPCEELKTELAAKLDAKHVTAYTLDVVPADQNGDGKVIGTCEGGTKKIVYTRK
jgi:predicted lipoprotein with Yx(FWY)xxD motif